MSQGVLTPEEVKKISHSLETSPSCGSSGKLQKGGKSGASGKESGFHSGPNKSKKK